MQAPESLILLKKRCLKGGIIFKIIWLLSLVTCGAFIFFAETRPWAAAVFLIAVAASLGVKHVRGRYETASRILDQEASVYWVQPKPPTSHAAKKVLAGQESLVLHLTDGENLTVDLPEGEIAPFRDWLDKMSPAHFWGPTFEHSNL